MESSNSNGVWILQLNGVLWTPNNTWYYFSYAIIRFLLLLLLILLLLLLLLPLLLLLFRCYIIIKIQSYLLLKYKLSQRCFVCGENVMKETVTALIRSRESAVILTSALK